MPLVLVIDDCTKRFHDLLALRAQVDDLTGVFNRAHLDRRLAEEVARSVRYGNVFTLVLADLDHFKKLNDAHGHPFGDSVLQTFADILTRSVRATDVVCRYGGEEFALILPETDPGAAVTVVERVRNALAEAAMSARGAEVKVTVSWGIASSTMQDAARLDSALMIEMADQALYDAKRNGRNCARIWHQPVERLLAVVG